MTNELRIENPVGRDVAERLLNMIRWRRSFSVNQMLPDPIDLGDVELMLEAANWAPSHGQTEPWRFSVYSGTGRQGLSDAFGTAYQKLTPQNKRTAAAEAAQRDRIWGAPVWISLGMEPDPRRPEWEELIAVACATQNAHLMASALGLGCKWTSNAIATHDHVAKFVGLEPPAKLLGFFYVGRPAIEWPGASRGPLAEKVTWVGE